MAIGSDDEEPSRVSLPYRTSARPVNAYTPAKLEIYLSNLDEVARRAYLQYLYCNLEPFVLALPYFTKPAPTPRSFHLIVAERNLYRPWDQSVVAAYLAQCGQTLPLEQRRHTIQRLLNVVEGFWHRSVDLLS